MQQFKKAAELFTKIRADLGNRTIPEFLTRGAALISQKVAEGVKEKAAELQPRVPPSVQEPKVYKFPPKAVVIMVGEGTPQVIEAYTKVFQDVNDTYLKERAKFLLLLHQGGVK